MRVESLGEPTPTLAIGRHVDDVELACAGTLLRLQDEGTVSLHILVLSGSDAEARPVRHGEAVRAGELLGAKEVQVLDFPDTDFMSSARAVQREIEDYVAAVHPAIVFCPAHGDRHQDHRVVAEAIEQMPQASQAILRYQVLPLRNARRCDSLYVDLSGPLAEHAPIREKIGPRVESYADAKTEILQSSMASQLRRRHLDPWSFPLRTS